MIDQKTVDSVIETANSNIVDIVGEYVSLKRRGANYVGCCPFHNEKTGSFSVSKAKGIYKCFGCGKAGNAVSFIMEHEHMDFVEAIKFLGPKVGIYVKDEQMTPEMEQAKSRRESLNAVCEFAKNTFSDNLWNTPEGVSVGLPYFRTERGFRDDIIKKFDLGFSLSKRDAFTQLALTKGYKEEFLQEASLSIIGENGYKSDRFFGRVMFPIHSISGRVVAFGGRVMVKSDKVAKYVNSQENELYHKSDVVYGIFQAKAEIVRKDRCYLVEGYTDVISMHQAGITNVIASCGTSLTNGQIHVIQRFTNNITVLYDGDAAGIHAAVRGIDMILAEGMNVKVLLLPDGDDPDSFARNHNAEEYVAYIEEHQTDFIRFKAKLLMDESKGDPTKRSEIINDMVRTISVVQDTVLRTLYVKECSKLMDIDEATLFKVLEKILVDKAHKEYDDREKQKIRQRDEEQKQRAEDSMTLTESQMANEPPAIAMHPGNYSDLLAKRENPFAYEEKELVKYFVNYVDQTIFENTDGKTTVGEYIIEQLQKDNIQSVDPSISALFQSYIDAPDHSKVKPEFFINQANTLVNSLAVDVIESKYKLSTYHQRYFTVVDEKDRLDELIPHLLNQIRLKKLMKEIDQLNSELKELEETGAPDEQIDELMAKLVLYNEAKRRIAKVAGNRTII